MPARHDPPPGDTPEDHSSEEDSSDEARWAEIVAELGDLGIDEDALDEDDDDPGSSPRVTYRVAPGVPDNRPGSSPAFTGRDWDGTAQIDRAESEVDDDEHFVPPDPGPIFSGNPALTLAWIGAAGGAILLLVLVVIGGSVPAIVARVTAGVFVASCAFLVWRMPHRRDHDDDDPGAVV
ncbi:hypothetical protein [Cellulomonas sp. P24]|uniref:hypothetical protein n=1 Tax=Cellulomonas sp. P24 TaxID=2885206 RepID=UPI00216B58A6|nr:hypothetical protein [Cellulomonas sp. P24]MCR6494220.1 hypothetical protein [Cellulomonas sp. P24]